MGDYKNLSEKSFLVWKSKAKLFDSENRASLMILKY